MSKIIVEFRADRVGVKARFVSAHAMTQRGMNNARKSAKLAVKQGIESYGNMSGARCDITIAGETYSDFDCEKHDWYLNDFIR